MKKLFKLFPILGIALITSFLVGCSDDDKNSEALILGMTFENPIVTTQPFIEGTSIGFYVEESTAPEDLKELIPIIKVSKGATVDPDSGTKVDFSAGSVKFTVTAEDGVAKTEYTVSCLRTGKYDFEEWVLESPESNEEEEYMFYAPVGGWSSSNTGALLLLQMTANDGKPFADRFLVTQSSKEDAYTGNKAARIETIDTKGGDLKFVKIPKVTTGSLFLGKFIIDSFTNTLSSTKFGIPNNKKPVAIKGYYKYTPGAVFYRSTKESPEIFTIEEGTEDECAINAILYEIENDDAPYITGENTYDEAKLVAIAKLEDGTAKGTYTEFKVDMKYLKQYDPAKKYRFSIICSSSKYGDTFSGAPGSVLYVDDIEVVYE